MADCGKSGTIEKSDGALPMVMAVVCCQGSWEQEAPLVAVVAQAISDGKLFPTKAQYIWKDSTSKAAGGTVYCIVCLPGGPRRGPFSTMFQRASRCEARRGVTSTDASQMRDGVY